MMRDASGRFIPSDGAKSELQRLASSRALRICRLFESPNLPLFGWESAAFTRFLVLTMLISSANSCFPVKALFKRANAIFFIVLAKAAARGATSALRALLGYIKLSAKACSSNEVIALAEGSAVTLEDIKSDERLSALLNHADDFMKAIGYTEHGFRHANLTASIASNVLKHLGLSERDAELAGIAGYLHDVGNVIGRDFHGIASATLVKTELDRLGMQIDELAMVLNAIGNHEEEYGSDTSPIGAAVVLADKSDVHRTRVRNPDPMAFDIHDRVNYAAERSFLRVEPENKIIQLEIDIDTSISQVMEYFEIFLSRMVRCRRAAQFLGCKFSLIINKTKLL